MRTFEPVETVDDVLSDSAFSSRLSHDLEPPSDLTVLHIVFDRSRPPPETPPTRASVRRPSGRPAAPGAAAGSPASPARPARRARSPDSAQRRGSSATPICIATARLMPSRLGSDTRMLAGNVVLLEQPEHAVAHVRRVVVRDDRLPRALRQRHLPRLRPADATDGTSMTSSSWPEDDRAEPRLGGLEREHAEVEAALRHLGADLPRRDAADVDVHQRMRVAETLR